MDRIEQFSTIAPDIGNIFRYISTVTAVPLLVALIYREWEMVLPMASVPVTLFLLGSLLAQVPRQEREAPLSAALMAVALIWLVCALVSALPFTFGLGVPYLDGVFEAMSGWTDTGMTMMRSVEDLPRTLLFWRVADAVARRHRGRRLHHRDGLADRVDPVPPLPVGRAL